ncbi:hypothetical protein Acr_20g0004950 [Actinidia rufa]|uniref:Uncharacterized protein n=1 Tax=Actinidia rufa TaxID=165716 RepID=A0A7J0GD02_9ERIC|nr:hypothetical protein Acr_20g0004950 [Actinidia rufa]
MAPCCPSLPPRGPMIRLLIYHANLCNTPLIQATRSDPRVAEEAPNSYLPNQITRSDPRAAKEAPNSYLPNQITRSDPRAAEEAPTYRTSTEGLHALESWGTTHLEEVALPTWFDNLESPDLCLNSSHYQGRSKDLCPNNIKRSQGIVQSKSNTSEVNAQVPSLGVQ